MDVAVVQDLWFGYWRRRVFDGMDLRLGPGVTGLLGPNGAGKSSLLALLATRRSPRRGRLSILGRRVSDPGGRAEVRGRLGYLEQRFSLVGSMRVLDTVAYAAWAHGRPRRGCFDDACRALRALGLEELSGRRVRTLSGGQRQRVGLAAAVVHGPELLLLDEPTAGLDPQVRVEIRHWLQELAQSTSIIMSTHLVDDVGAVCDDVVVLDQGRVVFHGAVTELADRGDGAFSESAAGAGGNALERGYMAVLGHARVGV